MASLSTLRRSPLYGRHVALHATLADFAGWEMPIAYSGSGGGVLVEHAAVRSAVGLFDVSHLGKVAVRGPGAVEFLNQVFTNDLDRVGSGKAQYTFCCDRTGGTLDDLIVYCHGPDEAFLVPNAANVATIASLLADEAPAKVAVHDLHEQYGILAVQGPYSADVLNRLGLPTSMPYLSFSATQFGADNNNSDVVVCRTGYTGEHGYELVVKWDATPYVWDALLEAGADFGIRPCGLGARDTLRTEMGYLLHGHDISPEITPVQAAAGWAVGWNKPRFWGKEALIREKTVGPTRLLWGIKVRDRGIPRPNMAVLSDSDIVGFVTSGTHSPTLRQGIGLALLSTSGQVSEGSMVQIDIRGRLTAAEVVRPPFVPSHVRV